MASYKRHSSSAFLTLALISCCLWLSTQARPYGLPSICLQPPPRSEGVCTIEIEGFYFSPRTNECQMYISGGCRASRGQSFGDIQDCIATCVHGTRRVQDLYINE